MLVVVELPKESFIFDERFYYMNGRFYRRSPPRNSLVFPVMSRQNEKSLVEGYLRRQARHMSVLRNGLSRDIIKLITSLYPSMCGGIYDVHEHNRDLANQLEQKTKEFNIAEIRCWLKFGALGDHSDLQVLMAGGNLDPSKNQYWLCLDFTKSKAMAVVLRVSVRCRNTRQCISILRHVDAFGDPTMYLSLPKFDPMTTSLSSLVCDLQIVSMVQSDGVEYEVPAVARRSAFLLEWTLDDVELAQVRTCCELPAEVAVASTRKTFE